MTIFKAACVQMNSGPEIKENLTQAESLIRQAAAKGAQFIATPENTCRILHPSTAKIEVALSQEQHPAVPFFSSLAKELNVWLLIGSMAVKGPDGKLLNRSFLFSDQGRLVATYDKIHMFDAHPKPGEVYKESATMMPGQNAVVVQTPFGNLGLSICYDVRFSYLYRAMAKAGANIIAVPAAFTVPTGQAHWEVLLRARAIETGSFVIAPAQTGEHQNGRKTWGHSMIIGPWGEILAVADQKPCIITADLNLDDVIKARKSVPALSHDREFKIVNIGDESHGSA